MKKFLILGIILSLLYACDKDSSLKDQKVTIGFELDTKDLTTNVKAGVIELERGTTPACVRELTIHASHVNGDSYQDFKFTNPEYWDDVNGNQNHVGPVVYTGVLAMDLWAGSNTITAETTSFVEQPNTDPQWIEADGISNGGPIDEFIQYGNPDYTGTKKIAYALRAIPPFAEFHTESGYPFFVDLDHPGIAHLNMVSNHGRMIVTFEFAEGISNYIAELQFDDLKADGTGASGKCPARTVTADETVWYYWTNEECVAGAKVNVNIVIKEVSTNKIVRTISYTDFETRADSQNVVEAGIDTWLKVIINQDILIEKQPDFSITYNWENEDNELNITDVTP